MRIKKSVNAIGGLTTYSVTTTKFGVSAIFHQRKWHKRIKISRGQMILPFGALEWFSFSDREEIKNENSV